MAPDKSNKLSTLMKDTTIASCLLLIAVHFYPIWRIELTAPQYPEGLVLEIWANKLAGNVDIISGVNHYIRMRQLHTEDFPEFSILPWIMIGITALGVVVLLVNRKTLYNAWFYIFIAIS